MNRDFTRYTVEILDKEFVKENVSYLRTAIVSTDTIRKPDALSPQKGSLATIEQEKIYFGYMEPAEVYQMIDQGFDIRLDHCYVKNFSLTDYRTNKELSKTEKIRLPNFSAENAFFDSDISEEKPIDFSHALFDEGKVSFHKTVFGNGGVTFESAHFGKGDVDFEYTLFYDGNACFSNTIFLEGDVTFRNAIFREGKKDFDNANFGDGQIIFLGTDFGIGNVSFDSMISKNGDVLFKVAFFGKGKIDFGHANFGTGEVSFLNTIFGEGNVNFKYAHFTDGKIDFTRAKFGSGEVAFSDVDFGMGEVIFVDTDFNEGKVLFKSCKFLSGKVDFHFSKFGKGDVIFDKSEFGKGLIDFRAVDFDEGKINFYRTEFADGDIVFEGTKLHKGRLNFKHTIFAGGSLIFVAAEFDNADVVFDYVNFGQKSLTFESAKFANITFNACHINNYIDMRVQKCNKLDFSSSIIRDILDLRPTDYNLDIKAIDWSGVRLLGKIFIDWHDNNVKQYIYGQDTNNRNRSEQFRMLKENFNDIGQYSYEDEAYIEFKRTEAKANLAEANRIATDRYTVRKHEAQAKYQSSKQLNENITLLQTERNSFSEAAKKAKLLELVKTLELLQIDSFSEKFKCGHIDTELKDVFAIAKNDLSVAIKFASLQDVNTHDKLIEAIKKINIFSEQFLEKTEPNEQLTKRIKKSGLIETDRTDNLNILVEYIYFNSIFKDKKHHQTNLSFIIHKIFARPKQIVSNFFAGVNVSIRK